MVRLSALRSIHSSRWCEPTTTRYSKAGDKGRGASICRRGREGWLFSNRSRSSDLLRMAPAARRRSKGPHYLDRLPASAQTARTFKSSTTRQASVFGSHSTISSTTPKPGKSSVRQLYPEIEAMIEQTAKARCSACHVRTAKRPERMLTANALARLFRNHTRNTWSRTREWTLNFRRTSRSRPADMAA